ncbi:hypothetical protein MIC448_320011 [Microbacterium sp. C448]|uniref:hypothetical protein n=1 Tax=Microbacterium sp. C448 TaxID=1177594 RepID=UPI0003DE23CE|nr:hypothetical protein [Microbacterium sp. C448]CDK00707.1 hypothetical protein MIC448_320011 [Microbacterium sp. C448]
MTSERKLQAKVDAIAAELARRGRTTSERQADQILTPRTRRAAPTDDRDEEGEVVTSTSEAQARRLEGRTSGRRRVVTGPSRRWQSEESSAPRARRDEVEIRETEAEYNARMYALELDERTNGGLS